MTLSLSVGRFSLLTFVAIIFSGALMAAAADAPEIKSAPTGRFGIIPKELVEISLAQAAPSWSYTNGKRSHPFNEAYALYTLALASYTAKDKPDEAVVTALATRLHDVVSGGKEPECMGGLGGWSHSTLAWAVAFSRHTPAVWSKLSAEDQAKMDLLMEALAVAANFCLDDDNDFRTLIDGDKNFRKTMNPNHVEGYVGVALAAGWYFGPDQLDRFFSDFDFNFFLARLKAANFTNVVACWTVCPDTRRVLMEGGAFRAGDPSFGNGRGIHGNTFTYKGFRLSDPWKIYQKMGERMFSHIGVTEIPITGRTESTHILAVDGDGKYLKSPYDGQAGMCYEFKTNNAQINGSGFRSSLLYVYEGWRLDVINAVALLARDLWPRDDSSRNLALLMQVGTADFFFKAKNGYAGFANGKPVVVDEQKLKNKAGWVWSKSLWEDVLAPFTVPLLQTPNERGKEIK